MISKKNYSAKHVWAIILVKIHYIIAIIIYNYPQSSKLNNSRSSVLFLKLSKCLWLVVGLSAYPLFYLEWVLWNCEYTSFVNNVAFNYQFLEWSSVNLAILVKIAVCSWCEIEEIPLPGLECAYESIVEIFPPHRYIVSNEIYL